MQRAWAGGLSLLAMVLVLPVQAQQAYGPDAPSLRLSTDNAASTLGRSISSSSTSSSTRRTQTVDARGNAAALPQPAALSRLPRLQRLKALTTGSIDATAPVAQRRAAPRPYESDGLRIGSFVLRGESEVGGVFTTRRDGSGDDAVGFRSAPDMRLTSNWARHELDLHANGEFITWHDKTGEARGTVGAALRLDVRRDTRLRLELEDAMDKVSAAGGGGTQHEVDGRISLEHERYRLMVRLQGGVLRHLEPEDGRDYWQPHVSLRGRVRGAPALAFYGEVGADARRFDRNGAARDSRGGYVEAGVELLRGPIWQGQVGVRLARRDYRNAGVDDFVGIGVNGNLDWQPTRRTQVRMEAAFALDDDSAGRTRQQKVALALRQQLRSNVDARLRLEAENNDVQNAADTLTLRASASLGWQIWRRLWLVTNYGYERDLVDGAAATPAEHRFGLGLRHRF